MKLHQVLPLLLTMLASTHAPAQFATTINDNSTTPAAPTGAVNVVPQNDGGRPTVNVTHYVLYPTIQVNCPVSGDLSAPVNAAIGILASPAGGIVDARRCQGATAWSTAITVNEANTTLLLPCASLTASQTLSIAPGVRNVTIHGCAYQGGSAGSGTNGGTVWNYTGSGTAIHVGDATHAVNTVGFALTDMALTTPSAGSTATALLFDRVQEIDIERVYFIGNNGTGQTGITLDGTGNYSGGSFQSFRLSNFGTALLMTGNGTGAANASTFTRMHLNCPTSGGSPISGGIGVNLAYGDGNTFVGGDIEGCDSMLILGAGATNNTFNGVRNENSNSQVSAAAGSQYNLWLAAGTLFTGQLTDAGTHNSFVDSFHRGWNNLNGDLWRSQADATLTNHTYLGIGLGNVRGLQTEFTTDVPGSAGNYQNAWIIGLTDGAGSSQEYYIQDVLNSLPRFGIQQGTTAGGNWQSFLNSTGTATVCFNCSTGASTGGVVISTGGATPTTAASIDGSGNLTTYGVHNFYSGTTHAWSWNCASLTVCALRNDSATTPANVFRAFPNAGTEIDSQATSAVAINNTSTAGTGGLIVYQGGANSGVTAWGVNGSGVWSSAGSGTVGSASGTGSLAIGNHLNQIATDDYAGACTMTGGTTCTVNLQHSYSQTPLCFAQEQGATGIDAWCSVVSNNATITAASANSKTFAALVIGNPN
jgi:hypothetical protein